MLITTKEVFEILFRGGLVENGRSEIGDSDFR